MTPKPSIRSIAVGVAVIASLALTPGANAGPLVASASGCATQTLSQPFLLWTDVASYTLNPGGAFEDDAAGWSLSGASLTTGNEPFYVSSPSDSHSLSVPNGASATSAPICVGIEHPDLRFFAKASSPSATLNVEVLFETASGDVVSLPIGAVTGNTGWAPTVPMPIVANLPLLPGGQTAVAFRFTASGGCFLIDDVYVDPYARN